MTRRSAARLLAVCILGLSASGAVHAGHGGRGAGHAAMSGGFRGGSHVGPFVGGRFHHFGGGPFHRRVFVGGAVFLPFYFPPPYYYPPPPVYYPPPAAYVAPSYPA